MSSDMVLLPALIHQQPSLQQQPSSQTIQEEDDDDDDYHMAIPAVVSQDDGDVADVADDRQEDSEMETPRFTVSLNNSPPPRMTTRRSPRRRRNSVAPKAMRMAASAASSKRLLQTAPSSASSASSASSTDSRALRSVRLVVKVEGQVVEQGDYYQVCAPNPVTQDTMDQSHESNNTNADVDVNVNIDMNINNTDSQSPRKRSWDSSTTTALANNTLQPLVRLRTPLKADGTPLRKPKQNRTLSLTEKKEMASLTKVLPLGNHVDQAQVSLLEAHTHRLFPCLSIAANAAHSCVIAPILAAFELFGSDASTIISGSELNPLLSLFEALVQLELVLLSSDSTSSGRGSASKRVNRTSKQSTTRVHFAAFDGSALQPPSDVLEGSHQHQEATIEGLTNVLRVVDDLSNSDTNQLQASATKLSQLIDYLGGDSFASEHAQLCADVLSLHSGNTISTGHIFYPVKRVMRAASSYLDDFRVLLSNWQTRLNSQSQTGQELPLGVPSMSWHIRLSDAISQLVRYWLRTQLNPVPDRAPAHCSSQEWMQRVSDIVSLAVEESSGSSLIANAIDDGSLSSLVSNATSHIFEFFGPNLELWKEKMESTPTMFLEGSRLAIAGIAPSKGERSTNKRRRSGPSLTEYSDEEWDGVEGELEIATSFLAAVQGAAFLQELLSVIVEHPDPVYCNAWQDTIQAAAKHLEETPARVALHSQDSHLVLLQHSPSVLLSNLPGIINMDKRDACQSALQQFAKRFLMKTAGLKMDAKMTRRKRSYQPYVGNLEYTYELAISKTAFPFVVSLEE